MMAVEEALGAGKNQDKMVVGTAPVLSQAQKLREGGVEGGRIIVVRAVVPTTHLVLSRPNEHNAGSGGGPICYLWMVYLLEILKLQVVKAMPLKNDAFDMNAFSGTTSTAATSGNSNNSNNDWMGF